ncbi:ANTH domain-containing protein [Boletus edulis]|nr:ANTH domain-containing protein [Boletus edulis]
MSSLDKVVKLACKPKPAPPKAKYLDPIIAATWSEDGAVHDVCKALVPRLREPNAIVVFKALIVLHTMIRNGATDNVLSHLSSSEILRLRNVSTGNWEGYNAPQNMQHYALYLDSRIRAYRELKHDAIRVQAETNRDLRLNNSIEEDLAYTTAPPPKASSTKSKTPQRSKTIMGRKLRLMTVEKGLLRETKTVQKMIDSLVECRFYLDDLEDELTITALRMLVKDILILFQAGNEGVINVLEHYFEMSKYDAEEALSIYRNFCDQTERVVEYLGVAKKLQNLLNVSIPNLKHAPVSLASSLQEYLDDPNFERNRLEYKASKAAPDRSSRDRNSAPSTQLPGGTPMTSMNSTTTETSVKPPSPPPTVAKSKPYVNHPVADFFGSIEEAKTPPVTGSPTANQLQQTTVHNPFIQRQMTGAFPSQPYGGQLQVQPTGFPHSVPFQFVQPFQPTQLPLSQANGFTIESQQAPQHRPFSTFIPQQATGLQSGPTSGFLRPQPTGANPFRQSMLVPQATGIPAFNGIGIPPVPPPPVPQTESLFQTTSNPQSQLPGQLIAQFGQARQPVEVPARPASTPLTSVVPNSSSASPPIVQPVKSHQTGSRNPFGVPVTPAPPVPKPPTLLELSMGLGRIGVDSSQPIPQSQSSHQATSTATTTPGSIFSTVASSFAFTHKPEENYSSFSSDLNSLASQPSSLAPITSNASGSLFSSLSSQTTNSTVSSHALSVPMTGPIKAQPTGFGGVKPFKPTSSFGALLLDSLPPIPQSGTTTPDPSAQPPTHTSAPSLPTNLTLNGSVYVPSVGKDSNVLGGVNSQPTGVAHPSQMMNGGPTLGVGLRPQATGALGAANPFRATMFATSAPSTVSGVSGGFTSSASTPSFGGLSNGTGVLPAFGSGFGHSAFGPSFTHLSQDSSNTQQRNAGASLI